VVARALAIRPCKERDLEHFGAFGSTQHVDYCREQWSRGAEALTILVAADEQDLPVGKLHLDFETHAHERTAVLIAAAVTTAAQGHGVGTTLIGAAEELVCSRGFGAIVLGVEDSNPRARRLYERLGYEAFARDEFRYLGAPVPNPGTWLRKELEC
jgi:ribosomal protein S18 acetylase RimI-like enzyme